MSNATMTKVKDVLSEIHKSVKNPKPLPWRLGRANEVGEGGRQGDVYFKVIEKPARIKDLTKVKDFTGQLAPGNTRGSRHIVQKDKVVAYNNPKNSISSGMILHTKEDCTVDHPDHGTVMLEGDMWIEVGFQVNWYKDQAARVSD